MTQASVTKLLEQTGPLKRADILQFFVSRYEIQGKEVPTFVTLDTILQKMLDSNRVYIRNAPTERDLAKFPFNERPAWIDLESRRNRDDVGHISERKVF